MGTEWHPGACAARETCAEAYRYQQGNMRAYNHLYASDRCCGNFFEAYEGSHTAKHTRGFYITSSLYFTTNRAKLILAGEPGA